MEKKYLSEYEVMLATLKELGGDVNKNYASLYDVELAILKAVQEGGGGGGGGLTPEQVHNIVESYNYTTMQAVENKQFMKQKKLTLNGDEPLQILDEESNVLSYNDVKALVDNKALFVYMLVDNAFYIPCGDMVIPSGHNALEFSSAFIVNGTANIARIIIDTADEVLYEQYILVDTDTLSGYATKDEIPSVEGLASEQWVEEKNYATKDEIPSVEGLATEEFVNAQIESVRGEIPSVDGLASEQWVEEQGFLTEHQPLKTINGQEIVGEGDIEIQGGGSSNVVNLTQAEYDELETKDPNTIYNITDAVNPYVKREELDEFASKQELADGITEAEDYADSNFVPTANMEGYLEPYIKRDDAYNAFAEKDEIEWVGNQIQYIHEDIEGLTSALTMFVKAQQLTQAQYDALTEKDPMTLYVITDAEPTSEEQTEELINQILS